MSYLKIQTRTLITHISWGKMQVTIDEKEYVFRDCKVWNGGVKEWDWNLTGTHHQPGIQPADIKEILDQGVQVMILSRGMDLMLYTATETEQLLKAQRVEYYIEETKAAVEHFNRLIEQGRRVGGIFHSTC